MAESPAFDPSIALGLPPARDASDEDKGRYVVARFSLQNDHYEGPYKTIAKGITFLNGDHWRTRWDGTSMSWQAERDVPAWHQQPVTNLVYAVYRTALAKLTKQKPTMEVVPRSGDSEDKEAAELSDALLTYLWRYLRKSQKMPVLIGWMLLSAKTYVRVGWDPLGGEMAPRTIPLQRQKPRLGGSRASIAAAVTNTDERPSDGTAGGAADETGTIGTTDGSNDVAPNDYASLGDESLEDVHVAADEHGEPYRTDAGDVDYDREPDLEPCGEICWEVVSPLCVRLNPEATSEDDAYEMFVATLWPKEKAAKHFGVKVEQLTGVGESDEQRKQYEDLMNASTAQFPRSWQDQSSSYGVSQEGAIGNRVLVIEYYHDITDQFPQGRHWINAGAMKVWPPTTPEQAKAADASVLPGPATDEDHTDGDGALFKNGEAPLPFGFWPPLVSAVDTPVPGQTEGVAVIPQVVPLNEQLNTLDGKIAEKHVVDAMGGIWFASPEDKGLNITSEPGQVIYSKAMGRRGQAFAPFQAQLHAMPDAVYREREVVQGKAMMVSGLSSLDLSQKPQGMPSGRALLVGQETSDSVLMPTLFAIESLLEECGRRELVIAQQKYGERRTIAVKGEDGQWLYRSFCGADLRSGHDVRVQVGSSFPWSKAAQWDTKLSVIQAIPQLVLKADGTVDKQALAKYLDAGAPGLGTFESDEDPNLIEIQREHAQFEAFDPERGDLQFPQIAMWQDHAVHLQEHYNFMKRDRSRFDRWHPLARRKFLEHLQLTLMAIEDAATRVVGAGTGDNGGAAQPGGPGGPGAPGAPGAAPGAQPAPPLSLVPNEQANGGAPPPGPPTQLNPSDFAAATGAA